MAEQEKHKTRERAKVYVALVAVALLFMGLMGITTWVSTYTLNQTLQADLVATVKGASDRNYITFVWSIISSIVTAVNAIVSIMVYPLFRKMLKVHEVKQREHFTVKVWPVVGMGFLVSISVGVLSTLLAVTKTSLTGIDIFSVYNALVSGQAYGIFAVLIVLPILGVILVGLAPRAFHYIEKFEKDHHIPDIPSKEKSESKKDTQNN